MLNNFVDCDFFFTKLSGIDSCEKHINILGGNAWQNFFVTCSKLEAMAIYVVKKACGNEIMPSVYVDERRDTLYVQNTETSSWRYRYTIAQYQIY